MADSRKSDIGLSPAVLAHELFGRLGIAVDAHLKIAFSGGLDSHVLLHALSRLRSEMRLVLSALHVDHGLQAASDAWARHCRSICAELDVPCTIVRVRVEGVQEAGPEAAARRARYAAFAEHVGPGEVLITAHHRDDQAETVLLRLLRGAGVHGLAGMPEATEFGRGRLARPLLGFSRAALEAYGRAQGLHWIEDLSNLDRRYRRNIVRHDVLPLLKTTWPAAAEVLARSAQHAGDAASLLDEIAAVDMHRCRFSSADAGNALSVAELEALSDAHLRNLLRYWLRAQGLLPPSAQHLDEIVAHVRHRSGSGHARVRWPGAEVRRYRDMLVAMTSSPPVASGLDVDWDLSSPLRLPGVGELSVRPAVGRGLARGRLPGASVQVRLRRGGETCRLPGRGFHHKVKKLLQSTAVPPWDRERLPLLYVGGALAAIADLYVCEPYAAAPGEPGVCIVWRPPSRQGVGA